MPDLLVFIHKECDPFGDISVMHRRLGDSDLLSFAHDRYLNAGFAMCINNTYVLIGMGHSFRFLFEGFGFCGGGVSHGKMLQLFLFSEAAACGCSLERREQ